uniref:Uncharacterized protein n=1 Tax=Oryza brachyantha TaxID=4533 RepID=J3KWY2_ORYBR
MTGASVSTALLASLPKLPISPPPPPPPPLQALQEPRTGDVGYAVRVRDPRRPKNSSGKPKKPWKEEERWGLG